MDKIEKIKLEIKELLSKRSFQPRTDWSSYEDALSYVNEHVWSEITPLLSSANPLAYATRSKGLTGIYEVYVNPYVPAEIRTPLKLHEFGHIIFAHLTLSAKQREIIIRKILSHWGEIKTHIEDSALKEGTSKANDIANSVCDSILNIAMDMEVNSKLFTEEEWADMVELTQFAYAHAVINSSEVSMDNLKEVKNWVKDEKAKPVFIPVWPKTEEYSFPLGLEYEKYIDLILNNQDSVFEFLKDALSNSSSSSSEDSSGSKSGSGKLSTEDIDKMRSQINDGNNDANISTTQKAMNGNQNGSSTDGNDGSNYSPVGTYNKSFNLSSSFNTRKLEEFIKKNCNIRTIRNSSVDNMYYYNKRKYSGNVLIGRTTTQTVQRPGDIYLLVDCSGSVSTDALSKIITAVKNISRTMGKKSRIIWWNTELAGDYSLMDIHEPKSSGGTYIAGGISYIKNKYLKNPENKLIVVSDYEDSMTHWLKVLDGVKNDCVGICWTRSKVTENLQKYLLSTASNSNDGISTINKLLKKLPTILVEI